MAENLICENNEREIQCGADEVLNIVTARYGRFDYTTCPHPSIKEINCESNDTYDVITALCQNKNSCTVKAHNSEYGDSCPGTYKYLTVIYTCQNQSKFMLHYCVIHFSILFLIYITFIWVSSMRQKMSNNGLIFN